MSDGLRLSPADIARIRLLHAKFERSKSGGHLLSLATYIPRLLDDHDTMTDVLFPKASAAE